MVSTIGLSIICKIVYRHYAKLLAYRLNTAEGVPVAGHLLLDFRKWVVKACYRTRIFSAWPPAVKINKPDGNDMRLSPRVSIPEDMRRPAMS